MPHTTSTVRKPLDHHIQELAAFEPTPYPVISLYLDLSSDRHGRDGHGPFVRNVLADRMRGLRPNMPEQASVERDIDRIEAYLRDELDPASNGLACFACAGMNLFEAVQLGAPVDRHWLSVGPVPHLYPLVRLADRYPRYAAVMLDPHRARICVFGLNTVERPTDPTSGKTKRGSVGGWSQARYQRHVECFEQEHVEEVVETLDRLVAEEGIAHIVVIGDEASVSLLRAGLPPRLAGRLVDVIGLEPHASEDAVLQATLEALRTKDAETDAERVAQMLDAWRAGGLAVGGPAATLEALQLGQVEELLAAAGTPETLAPDTHDLVTRARQTGARIRFIEDAALLDPAGGVGALLRFRM